MGPEMNHVVMKSRVKSVRLLIYLTCTSHIIIEDTFGSLEEKKTISILRCDHKLDFPERSSSFLQ